MQVQEQQSGKAQHIPGPWKVFEQSWSDTVILADGHDHGICALDINHATEETQEELEAVMAANARLIAAAPELLEALIALAGEEGGDMQDVLRARAAISKATGEAA